MRSGQKFTIESRKKMSEAAKGRVPWNKGLIGEQSHSFGNKFRSGKKHSIASRKKIGESGIGKHKPWLGKKGIDHPSWIEDRSKLKKTDRRNDMAYQEWRKNVWFRDRFKCKISNNECNGRIEAHHIFTWSEHPELRYEINNGITLCHAHHPRKKSEVERMICHFQNLIN